MSKKCPVCGKQFVVLWPNLWSYKRDHRFMCTYGCMRAYDDRKGMNFDMTLTKEQRAKVLDMLIKGENPNEYIRGCGVKNPTCTVWNMKQYLKKNDPETFAKIPTAPAKKKIETPETVTLNGPVKIETPEGKTLARIDVPVIPAAEQRYKYNALEISGLGEFYFDKKHGQIDWRTVNGEEISMEPAMWKIFSREIIVMLQKLGAD